MSEQMGRRSPSSGIFMPNITKLAAAILAVGTSPLAVAHAAGTTAPANTAAPVDTTFPAVTADADILVFGRGESKIGVAGAASSCAWPNSLKRCRA
jgi:hypothetical protein